MILVSFIFWQKIYLFVPVPCMADLAAHSAQGQNVELNTIECPGSIHLYHQDDYIADKLQKTNWA